MFASHYRCYPLLGLYASGYGICTKYSYQHLNRQKSAKGLMEDFPNTERLYSTIPSMIISLVWPILLPFLVTHDLDRQHREAKKAKSAKISD